MYLLIPAAGMGQRMGRDRNKLLLTLLGTPLLSWTLIAAETAKKIEWIGIIGQPYDFPEFNNILETISLNKPVELIRGGETRQQSVYNGLQALPKAAKSVLIHDGARCLVTPNLFDKCAEELANCQGLIAAITVKDTIKLVDSNQFIKDPRAIGHGFRCGFSW